MSSNLWRSLSWLDCLELVVRVTQRASSLHEMCSHRLQRIHKGHKSKSASRTYNITVDHRRQILATTSGHSGSFNDKTTVLHYEFVTDMKSRAILDDYYGRVC